MKKESDRPAIRKTYKNATNNIRASFNCMAVLHHNKNSLGDSSHCQACGVYNATYIVGSHKTVKLYVTSFCVMQRVLCNAITIRHYRLLCQVFLGSFY